MFRNLLNKFKAIQDKGQRIQQFRATFNEAASDGILTEQELQDLENTLQQLDLTTDDIRKLKIELATDVIDKAIQDRRVSQEEQYGISEFMRRFNVPSGPLADKIAQIGHYRYLYAAEQGDLQPLHGATIIPKKNEVVYYSCTASTVEDKVVDSYRVGQSAGVSITIAKGVRYRVGASKGQKVEKRAMVTTSTGRLYVTNQRLVYDSLKPLEMQLSKLINMQVFNDGIMFGVSNRKNPIFFSMADSSVEGVAVTITAVINQNNT